MKILATGRADFIGSTLIQHFIGTAEHKGVNFRSSWPASIRGASCGDMGLAAYANDTSVQ